jgi:hypothetical protein
MPFSIPAIVFKAGKEVFNSAVIIADKKEAGMILPTIPAHLN